MKNCNLIEMRLADEPFEKIKNGDKTVEIRLYDKKRQKIKVGDIIEFYRLTDSSDKITTTVTTLHRFNTFKELFSSALFSHTGSGSMSIEEATEYMYTFYTKEQEQNYGVVGIEVRVEENFSLVLSILKDEYKDCGISVADIMLFAKQLNNQVFIEDCDLNDILFMVYIFEESMRNKGAVIDIGRQCCIYDSIINILEINEKNAKRLYDSFLSYHDCQAFSYLMNEFEKWITPRQREKIISIARETFIESVWEDYV